MKAPARRPGRYLPDATLLAREAFYSPWTPTAAEMDELLHDVADSVGGWPRELRYHTHDSRRSQPGFPDWTLVSPEHGRILFVELKGFGDKPTEAQRAFVDAINRAGGEACVFSTSLDYAQDSAALVKLLREPLPPIRRALQR